MEFEAGLPVAIDGVALPLHELVAELNAKAGAYGVGRIDMVENRAVGIKSREVYEAPAAIALIEAHRALEDLVLTKAELADQAPARGGLDGARLRGPLVQPRPRRDRRVRRHDASASRRATSALLLQAGSPPSSPAAARRTRCTPRRSPRTHRARRSRTRRPRASSASPRSRPSSRRAASPDRRRDMTLWSGRVREGLAPEVWAFLRADDAELLPYDFEATRIHAARLHAAGLLDDDELADAERGFREIAQLTSCRSTRTSTRRSSACSAPVGRKIHAGRSRNDQVAAALRLYVEDACAEAAARSAGWPRDILDRADDEAEAPMPGLHAPPARAAVHRRPSPARLGGDARARPPALPARGRRRAAGPLGAGALGRLDSAAPAAPQPAPELPRRRRRPGLRARLPLRVRDPARRTCRGSEKRSSSGRRPSSASSTCPKRRRPDRRCCRRS